MGGPLQQIEIEIVLEIGSIQYFVGDLAYLSVLGVAHSLIQFVLDEQALFFEEVRMVVFLEVGAERCCLGGLVEVEHFGVIFIKQYATVHFVECHFFFLDFLSSHALFLILLDEGKVIPCIESRVFSQGYKSISRMLFILFLF